MRPLKEVIIALRHELEAALHAEPTVPGGRQWEAERVVVSLELELAEPPGADGAPALAFGVRSAGLRVSEAAGAVRPPAVTIEFKLRANAATEAPLAASPVAAEPKVPGSAAPADPRVEALAQVFGAPGGFYSHLRAEVFSSTIEELPEDAYAQLLAAWAGHSPTAEDPRLTQAQGQIANLLRSCPAGSAEAGLQRLREALVGIGRPELRRLIAANWRNEGLASGLP